MTLVEEVARAFAKCNWDHGESEWRYFTIEAEAAIAVIRKRLETWPPDATGWSTSATAEPSLSWHLMLSASPLYEEGK